MSINQLVLEKEEPVFRDYETEYVRYTPIYKIYTSQNCHVDLMLRQQRLRKILPSEI
jgi:hypothetical protein